MQHVGWEQHSELGVALKWRVFDGERALGCRSPVFKHVERAGDRWRCSKNDPRRSFHRPAPAWILNDTANMCRLQCSRPHPVPNSSVASEWSSTWSHSAGELHPKPDTMCHHLFPNTLSGLFNIQQWIPPVPVSGNLADCGQNTLKTLFSLLFVLPFPAVTLSASNTTFQRIQ